jgi:hypothetical protein
MFQNVLINNIKETLKREDLYDFTIGKEYYNKRFGNLPEEINSLILDTIIISLKSGEILKIKHAIDKLTHDKFDDILRLSVNSQVKNKIERNFYLGLSKCLESKKFENFKQLVELSNNFDIFIDLTKIPNRFEIISKLHLDCIHQVSTGYQTSSLGDVIELLKFCNQFNLLERDLDEYALDLINEVKQDNLLLSNLQDLYGQNVSDSFLYYIREILPNDLYDFFINEPYLYFTDVNQLI